MTSLHDRKLLGAGAAALLFVSGGRLRRLGRDGQRQALGMRLYKMW